MPRPRPGRRPRSRRLPVPIRRGQNRSELDDLSELDMLRRRLEPASPIRVAVVFHPRRSAVKHFVPRREIVEHDFLFVEFLGEWVRRVLGARGALWRIAPGAGGRRGFLLPPWAEFGNRIDHFVVGVSVRSARQPSAHNSRSALRPGCQIQSPAMSSPRRRMHLACSTSSATAADRPTRLESASGRCANGVRLPPARGLDRTVDSLAAARRRWLRTPHPRHRRQTLSPARHPRRPIGPARIESSLRG